MLSKGQATLLIYRTITSFSNGRWDMKSQILGEVENWPRHFESFTAQRTDPVDLCGGDHRPEGRKKFSVPYRTRRVECIRDI